MKRLVLSLALLLAPLTARAEINIQQVKSPGGIDAWLVEEAAIPFVALEIVIDGGASLDEPGKRGATNLMMGLLEEGAGEMDARAFQTAREGLAASYGFRARDDRVVITARFLTENRDEAVDSVDGDFDLELAGLHLPDGAVVLVVEGERYHRVRALAVVDELAVERGLAGGFNVRRLPVSFESPVRDVEGARRLPPCVSVVREPVLNRLGPHLGVVVDVHQEGVDEVF